MSRVKKKPYITKEELEELTVELVKYNKANNPIKIFNYCYDYYVETYNIKPIKCDNWYGVIDIRKDYEYNRIEKSIKKMMNNTQSNVVRDFDAIRLGRQAEVNEYIDKVRARDPEKGKQTPLECPEIVWRGIEKIATNYAQNWKFFGYVQKEDLIMGAIEKCLRYIGNFSSVNSNNTFSFFSTTISNSFKEDLKRDYNYSNFKQRINDDFYGATNEEQSQMQEGNYIR